MKIQKFHYNCLKHLSFTGGEKITFNGINYIFLDPHNCKIILLNKDFCLFKAINLQRQYSDICFDDIHKCYWAICNGDVSTIYKLDGNFDEISKMSIKDAKPNRVSGISYNYCNSSLWVAFDDCIGYIEDKSNTIKYVHNKNKKMINKSILALPHCTLVSYNENCKQFIKICNTKGCQDLIECLTKGYNIEDMCLISFECDKEVNCSTYSMCLLLSEECSSNIFVIKCCIKFCENCSPEFIYKEVKECDTCKSSKECDECFCNKFNCNAKYEIMHSIALEEAGIAHILNAEGEKIQKAVACFDSVEELLCINESVKQTIIHITQLETQLYLKLSELQKNDCYSNCFKNCFFENKY